MIGAMTRSIKAIRIMGAKGVIICDDWKDFGIFYKWAMENGYEDGLTIDRIDVTGNYEPCNCRWSTKKEQANNKTNNHFVTYNGESKTLAEWEKITGIKQHTIAKRLRSGWSVEKALTEKVNKK